MYVCVCVITKISKTKALLIHGFVSRNRSFTKNRSHYQPSIYLSPSLYIDRDKKKKCGDNSGHRSAWNVYKNYFFKHKNQKRLMSIRKH